MPITPGCHSSPSSTCAAAAGPGERPPLSSASRRSASNRIAVSTDWRSVLSGVQLACHLHRALLVGGQHQLQPRIRAVQPAGGIDPWRQREPERRLGDALGVHAGNPHQRAQARAACPGDRPQPATHQRPVLPHERHQVGHRRERHDVELALELDGVTAGGRPQRLRQLERNARGAQVRQRVAAHRWMHDRAAGKLGTREVVVGDDNLHAELQRQLDLRRRGDATVNGDQQCGAGPVKLLHAFAGDPVALVPARQPGANRRPE